MVATTLLPKSLQVFHRHLANRQDMCNDKGRILSKGLSSEMSNFSIPDEIIRRPEIGFVGGSLI
jgi:hypothetical protein